MDRNPVLAEMLGTQLSKTTIYNCECVQHEADLNSIVSERAPDILFLDPDHLDLTKERDLVDFGREIRAASPKTQLLGYSFKVSDAMLRATLDAGFKGCVSKSAQFRQVEVALAVVLDGGIYFDKNFGSHLRPVMSETTETDGLSEREKAVLIGVARGLSAKQIATQLCISSKTVDTYKSRASKKLNLNKRTELVEYVHDKGWINFGQ